LILSRIGSKAHDHAGAVPCRAGAIGLEPAAARRGAQVGIVTVRQLEAWLNQPRRATLIVVRQTLEAAGVEFIDENGGGVGVRLRSRRDREEP
jgi:hypothetical protein